MNALQLLTDVATETPEATEGAFNLAQTLNDNPGVVMAIGFGLVVLTIAIVAAIKNYKKRR